MAVVRAPKELLKRRPLLCKSCLPIRSPNVLSSSFCFTDMGDRGSREQSEWVLTKVESRTRYREPGEAAQGGQRSGRVESLLNFLPSFSNGKRGLGGTGRPLSNELV